jgi:ComF family protein
LAPPACVGCGEPGLAPFCVRCKKGLESASPRDIDGISLIAGAQYAGAVSRAIRELKYEARTDIAKPLASLIAEAAGPSSPIRNLRLVPVPLHPKRLAERGYNQAALIARALSKHTRGRVLPLALARERDTPHQVGLERARREANVAGAFRVRQPRAVAGHDVVLVDDVVTTGATVRDCSRALGSARARVVAVACVASASQSADVEISLAEPCFHGLRG